MATYFVDMAVGDDVNAGTSAGAGNAWKTIDKAMNTVAAGDKVWVKASANYTETATIDTVGTSGSPIVLEGYTTSTGDGGQAVIDGASTRANGIADSLGGTASILYAFKNFHLKNHTSDAVNLGVRIQRVTFVNCRAENNAGRGFYVNQFACFYRCLADSNTGVSFQLSSNAILACCSIHTASGAHCIDGSTALTLYNVLIYNSGTAGRGVDSSGGNTQSAIFNCTIDGENAMATGIRFADGHLCSVVGNCIIYDCGTGIEQRVNDSGDLNVFFGNLLNSNTTNYLRYSCEKFGEVTGAPAFTDEAADDYTLTPGSPAKAAGFDAAEVLGNTSYVDIGAHQRQEAGGGLLVHPGTSGGARG